MLRLLRETPRKADETYVDGKAQKISRKHFCTSMKIVKGNAGALTNFEVLDFLNSRGASKDTTRVIAPIARSEYKVYDYLVETAACTQTRECVNKFAEKCKGFKVAKAEILNIINLRPSSIVELMPIIEKPDDREISSDGILLPKTLKKMTKRKQRKVNNRNMQCS